MAIRGASIDSRSAVASRRSNCFKITVAFPSESAILIDLLDKLSISRRGESSVESVFSDDLKPDDREQSVKEQ